MKAPARLTLLLAPLLLLALAASGQRSPRWRLAAGADSLAGEGFAKGTSASYAVEADGLLWWAGGCNFPDVPAADGGTKVYYDAVLTARADEWPLRWRLAGQLPQPAAYGAAVAVGGGMLCVGGHQGQARGAAVWLLRQAECGGLRVDTFPTLPVAVDNLCAAIVGGRVYAVGGQQDDGPTTAVHSLSLLRPEEGWRAEPQLPCGPRTQAIAVALRRDGEECLYVFGGWHAQSGGLPPTVSTSALCYVPSERRWHQVASPTDADGRPLSLGGGAGVAMNDSVALCMGGVDRDVFLAALQREARAAQAAARGDTAATARYKAAARRYMLQRPEDYRLNDRVLTYNAQSDVWTIVDRAPQAARAGAMLAGSGATYFWINGETKPGVRTPQVWCLSF